MKPGRRIRYGWAPLLAGALIACGGDQLIDPGIPEREFSVGSWVVEESGDRGVILLDITTAGGEVTGTLLLQRREGPFPWDPPPRLFVSGTREGDRLFLTLPSEEISPGEFSLAATSEDSGLSGTFALSGLADSVTFEAREVPIGTLSSRSLMDFSICAQGLAFDGASLWVGASLEGYLKMTTGGLIQDTITVSVDTGQAWTSDALTADGTGRLWGHDPVGLVEAGHRVSELVEFNSDGTITRESQMSHRTTGLAWDGANLWSLGHQLDTLYRMDDAGIVLERVPVEPPDLIDVDFDAGRFLAIGQILELLYVLDDRGRVLRVYDLPTFDHRSPRGVVFDGRHLFLSTSRSGASVLTDARSASDACASGTVSRIWKLEIDESR